MSQSNHVILRCFRFQSVNPPESIQFCRFYEVNKSLKFFMPQLKPWNQEKLMKLVPLRRIVKFLNREWQTSVAFQEGDYKIVDINLFYDACCDWIIGQRRPLHALYSEASRLIDS